MENKMTAAEFAGVYSFMHGQLLDIQQCIDALKDAKTPDDIIQHSEDAIHRIGYYEECDDVYFELRRFCMERIAPVVLRYKTELDKYDKIFEIVQTANRASDEDNK